MDIHMTTEAAEWYKEELSIQTPGYVRFFPRYGFGGHIPGFAIGINQEEPEEIHVSTKEADITFYIETKDAWYFDDIEKLAIDYNEKLDEPELNYIEKENDS